MNKNIYKAISEFHKTMPDVKKDSENPFFKSKYASLQDILPIVKENLAKHGMTFTQIPQGDNELLTVIYHLESGEHISGSVKMIVAKQDPQGQGGAITYMRRYALVSMLGLNTEEDDDGNKASGKKTERVKRKITDNDDLDF